MATKISFLKDSTSTTESKFCEAYTFGKQYKVHSKKSPIDTINELGICIYINLFDIRNILLGIGGCWYKAIFINETTRMRFLITIKSKNSICEKNKIVFNKIKIYTDKKMQYF